MTDVIIAIGDIIYKYDTLEKVLDLPNYDDITSILCNNIGLVKLPPHLPNSLRGLDCSDNPELTELPTELPPLLNVVICHGTLIKKKDYRRFLLKNDSV